MKLKKVHLYFTGQGEALLFFWALHPGRFWIQPDGEKSLELTLDETSFSQTRWERKPVLLAQEGISLLRLRQPEGDAVAFDILAEDGIFPFLVPGPGIMPSHFYPPGPNLFFSPWEASLFIPVPPEIRTLTLACGYDPEMRCSVFKDPGGELPIHWMPDSRQCGHKVAEIPIDGQTSPCSWWKVVFSEVHTPFRFTEWNGLTLFFQNPGRPFPYSYLAVETQQQLDFRLTILRCGQKEATWDLCGQKFYRLPYVGGQVQLDLWAGWEYRRIVRSPVPQREIFLDIGFQREFEVPSGWIRGDHHVHSYFEDAGSSPQRIAQAARANGLSYIVLTDLSPERLLSNRLSQHDWPGHFIALPGQELMNARTHMNALNVRADVDASQGEGSWIQQVREQSSADHPAILMLNHPSHRLQTASRPESAYFRSWWVASQYQEIGLVENCDFQTWFDFLNRGRKLICLWTTDTHDGTNYMPGEKCSFVRTEGVLQDRAIIEALIAGRVTNASYPGSFLDLSVDGKGIGDTVVYEGKPLQVEVFCHAAQNILRIELIADGLVEFAWDLQDAKDFQGSRQLNRPCRWVLARAYLQDGTIRSVNPEQFLDSGVRAFTNPIWIETCQAGETV